MGGDAGVVGFAAEEEGASAAGGGAVAFFEGSGERAGAAEALRCC